jgi:hypothetical protein
MNLHNTLLIILFISSPSFLAVASISLLPPLPAAAAAIDQPLRIEQMGDMIYGGVALCR